MAGRASAPAIPSSCRTGCMQRPCSLPGFAGGPSGSKSKWRSRRRSSATRTSLNCRGSMRPARKPDRSVSRRRWLMTSDCRRPRHGEALQPAALGHAAGLGLCPDVSQLSRLLQDRRHGTNRYASRGGTGRGEYVTGQPSAISGVCRCPTGPPSKPPRIACCRIAGCRAPSCSAAPLVRPARSSKPPPARIAAPGWGD